MIYAKVENGIVTNTMIFSDEKPPADELGLVLASDGVSKNWIYNGDGTFTPPPSNPIPPRSSRSKRQERLNYFTHDFEDGRVIQIRPKDEINIRNAIEVMSRNGLISLDWVMQDNKKYPVTLPELQMALVTYQEFLLIVWDEYDPEETELNQFKKNNPKGKKD